MFRKHDQNLVEVQESNLYGINVITNMLHNICNCRLLFHYYSISNNTPFQKLITAPHHHIGDIYKVYNLLGSLNNFIHTRLNLGKVELNRTVIKLFLKIFGGYTAEYKLTSHTTKTYETNHRFLNNFTL